MAEQQELKHSPVPWVTGDDSYSGVIFDASLKRVCTADVIQTFQVGGVPLIEANARFIVTAVNAHADLYAALKALLHVACVHMMAIPFADETTIGKIGEAVGQARNVLQQIPQGEQ